MTSQYSIANRDDADPRDIVGTCFILFMNITRTEEHLEAIKLLVSKFNWRGEQVDIINNKVKEYSIEKKTK